MRLEILNLIYKMKSAYFGALPEALDIPPSDLRAILINLIHEGYLYPTIDVNGPYALTSKGRELRLELSLLEQQEQQNDEDIKTKLTDIVLKLEKNSSDDLKVSVKESIVSSLIGKLVELLHILIKLIFKGLFML